MRSKVSLDQSPQGRSADVISVYKQLSEFPYYENYVELTRMELSVIQYTSGIPQTIAFIGSGPLPLTSICLCEALNAKGSTPQSCDFSWPSQGQTLVVNIDQNTTAISQSRALCAKLGSKVRGMEFKCEKAESMDHDLRGFDVVYLAALVGMTQEEKEDVVTHVAARMREGALLVIRTAHSLRTLLYAVRMESWVLSMLTLS